MMSQITLVTMTQLWQEQRLYKYNVEFVFERMVILTDVELNEPEVSDDFIIETATQELKNYYKIDPSVLYLQDVIVHEEQR